MLNNIDVIFRGYGVKALGEETMARLTDEQIDEARVYAFTVLGERTKRYGKPILTRIELLFQGLDLPAQSLKTRYGLSGSSTGLNKEVLLYAHTESGVSRKDKAAVPRRLPSTA